MVVDFRLVWRTVIVLDFARLEAGAEVGEVPAPTSDFVVLGQERQQVLFWLLPLCSASSRPMASSSWEP